MNELLGQFIYKNDSLLDDPQFNFGFLNHGINVYEVLRHVNGIPLFLEHHIRRLEISAKGKGLDFTSDLEDLRIKIKELCRLTNQEEGNLKIVLHSDIKIQKDLYIYPVPFDYPSKEQYHHGVKVISIKETRPDPNLKNWRPEFRKSIKALKASTSAYEVILINENGIVTEGSQSNLFFIKNNRIFTAHKKNVLPGITRDFIIEICVQRGIALEEIDYDINLLKKADSVFISGTSPKILPVSKIDNFLFNPKHALLFILTKAYNELIKNYINSNT